MIKKIFGVGATLFIIIFAIFLLWFSVFDGIDVIEEKTSVPEEPRGTETGFYYKNLEDTEKIAYELIVEKIENMPSRIRIPYLDDEGLSHVFEALLYDNPKYFFLSDNCKAETTAFGKTYFVPQYIMSAAEYVQKLEELEKVREVMEIKTDRISEKSKKEQIIHDYIIDKCRYADKTGGEYSSVYGCLVNGIASCEGYAKSMKYLLDDVGIENYIVTGTTVTGEGSPQGHAWNIVEIDKKHYHVDATWDDPDENAVENRYAYFNITDEEISLTHDVEDRFLGRCDETEHSYYVENGLYFTDFDKAVREALTQELVRKANLKTDVVSFRMSDKKAVEKAKEELFQLNEIYSILLDASILTDEILADDSISYAVDEKHNIIVITDFIE